MGLLTRAAEQEAAATHVSAADKVGREEQARAKNFKQRPDVFGSGDAAE